MLILFDAQLDAFAENEFGIFEDRMVAHCEGFLPSIAVSLNEAQRRKVVQLAMTGAERHALVSDGPMRLYVEYCVTFGCHFDRDVQLRWAKKWLGTPDPQTDMHRAEDLFEAGEMFLDEVYGPDDLYLEAAYERLHDFVAAPIEAITQDNMPSAALRHMRYIYPEKGDIVGKKILKALVAHAQEVAPQYGMTTPSDTLLLAVLMNVLGQGCLVDPLYPWLGPCLRRGDPQPKTPPAGERLRLATAQWLEAQEAADERLTA